jgi:hypothetical protein
MIYCFRIPVCVSIEANTEEEARQAAVASTDNWDDWSVDDRHSPSVLEALTLEEEVEA